MEQEQNRLSKSSDGLSTAQEADSFIVGNDKEKKNTCEATGEVDNSMEHFMRKKDAKMYHKAGVTHL